jgi:transposase
VRGERKVSSVTDDRDERRQVILEGVEKGVKPSEIAAQLGVNRWTVKNDLNVMKHVGDKELKQAVRKAQEQVKEEKPSVSHVLGERFMQMTGMTFQEKTFQNMIHFYGDELRKILGSEDESTAIGRLPKDVRRALIHNEIITKRNKCEITASARRYMLEHRD